MAEVIGQVHSIETLGGLDGPGLRCVVFLQGCPLRCQYCHNPDTWPRTGGQTLTPSDILSRIERCRPYFGEDGGVTLSGGEPLWQPRFAAHILAECHEAGIHTAVDTSGSCSTGALEKVLPWTDLVLLDIKDARPPRYRELTGGTLAEVVRSLDRLTEADVPTWIRQVVVPGWNDTFEQMRELADLLRNRQNIERVELLPYHRMAEEKWQAMQLPAAFGDTPSADPAQVRELQKTVERMRRPQPLSTL